MTTTHKYALRFAVVGFVAGEVLCGYAFYLTAHHRIGNEALFLILCPASMTAMGLDNAGVVGGLIGWFFISLVNACLYGLVGFGIGNKVQRSTVFR
jgi:hypothetical protein